jgi:hypothetical protein
LILTHDSEPWDHIVGVDPGETTGLCGIKLGPKVPSGAGIRSRIIRGDSIAGQVDQAATRELGRGGPWFQQEARLQRNLVGRLRAVAELWAIECLHLAIEDFTLRERTMERSLLSPVRMTAGVLALLEDADDLNVVVHLNSASDGKGTVNDLTLRRLGLYRAGMQHANDAARQAVLTLRKEVGNV